MDIDLYIGAAVPLLTVEGEVDAVVAQGQRGRGGAHHIVRAELPEVLRTEDGIAEAAEEVVAAELRLQEDA